MEPDQRAAFEERVAICADDGGLTEAQAIRIAADEPAAPGRPMEHPKKKRWRSDM